MTASVIFTIGHSNHPIAEFINWLKAHDIQRLVDIRRYPGSRRLPQFNRGVLQHSLAKAGIHYDWQGKDLGGRRNPAMEHSLKDCHHYVGLPEGSLRNFAIHMNSTGFRQAIKDLVQHTATVSSVIMCAEMNPDHCHRCLIGDYLSLDGHKVLHITGPGKLQPHQTSPAARLKSGSIYYDRGTQPPLDLD